MAKPVIGMQLYTMRDHCATVEDLNSTLKRLKEIGYTTTQVSGISKVKPEDIARAHEDNGLEIACTHMVWKDFLEDLDRVIEIHKMYKCKHPAIGGLGRGEEYLSLDGVKKFADELAPVAEKLRAEGMDFSFHNHAHEFTHFDGKPWLKHLYDTISAEDLKAEIDTYWVQAGGGSPLKWVKDMAGRMSILHLKEMRVDCNQNMYFAAIGDGNLDWPEIMQAAEEGGVEYAMYEQDNCYDDDAFELAKRTYDYLSGLGYK